MENQSRPLQRAFASTRGVLAEVGPEQLDAATPCSSWDVRALANHFVGSARWGASVALGTADQLTDQDYAAGDLLASYDDSIKDVLATFESAGVLEKTVELEFGRFSGAELMGMVVLDQFVHGWDLARAIGHPTDLDPELAGELLETAQVTILDAYRGPEGEAVFGPALKAPDDAAPADRLAAFLGRSL
jgi:uncharacterized protein (TIGR03086 family)